MKTSTLILMFNIVFVIGCSNVQTDEVDRLKKENTILKAMIGPPPAKLDSLYPPLAQAPLYQIKMIELGTLYSGFVLRIFEGDRSGAKVLFDSFREQYEALSEIVPQWIDDFPSQPLDELAALIEEGEPGEITAYAEKLGNICHSCHISNLPKVQQKYHWDDFSIISLTDPLSNDATDYRKFKMSLEMSFTGMGMELQQGQIEKAIGHFENFNRGLEQLKESCGACHDVERKYFVDAVIDELVSKLGTELQAESPDMQIIGQLSQQIVAENCLKCHLVHLPATYAKARWNEMDQFID